jgi:predicted amidohydrolase YtcJ
MHLEIPRLYDSHTHFLSTGQLARGLSLFSLKSAADMGQTPMQKSFFRGDWLVGFGWDENKWLGGKLPTRQDLDNFFPDFPVLLSRADGHSSWVNSKALEKLGWLNAHPQPLLGEMILRDEKGFPNGILKDTAHISALEKLPLLSEEQITDSLEASVRIFNRAGFTHIRDMSCFLEHWKLLHSLEDQKKLSLAYEGNFTAEGIADVDRALQDCLIAKKTETPRLRANGVKIFFDGSLGSETALLSAPYHGLAQGNRGFASWNIEDVKEAMLRTWEQRLEFSVHVIGDEAVHLIVKAAREVSAKGIVGRLNLEHVQMIRPETIVMMKPLHLRCHMQPCHWLSDQSWLAEKTGPLFPYCFPWESLRAAQIPISLGSDSPIEIPSFANNVKAIEESAKNGIRKFRGEVASFHSHPDKKFMESMTRFENGVVKEVSICGQTIPL